MDGRKKRSIATRQQILEGARTEFLKSGYTGTSLKAVAASAGVTQSLIHHHFGTKEQLWETVQEAGFQGVLKDLRPILSEAARSEGFLEVLFEAYFRYLEKHPDYVRLLNWTYADASQACRLQPGQARQATVLLEELREAGSLNREIETRVMLPLVWSLAEGWHMGRKDYARRLGVDEADLSHEAYVEAAIQVLRKGILKGGAEAR